MLTLPIKPGKYTTRDGSKAVVRYIETEIETLHPVLGFTKDTKWGSDTWTINGSLIEGTSKHDVDLVSEGWPLEIEAGKWYRDNHHNKWYGIGAIPDGRIACWSEEGDVVWQFDATGVCGNVRLVEECEPESKA